MVRAAFGAIPFPDIKRQLFNDVTTLITPFRTRKPSVNLDKPATIPIALVFKVAQTVQENSSSMLNAFVQGLQNTSIHSPISVFASPLGLYSLSCPSFVFHVPKKLSA
jgi:hypothetical protein